MPATYVRSSARADSIFVMSDPGETRDPRLTFGTVVDVYDEIRPTYPEALFDELFALLPSEPEILEVGPGTGQATRDLLARGARVHGVEISPLMADRLRSNLPTERLRVTVGDFETIDLAAAERRRGLLGECVPLDLSRGPTGSTRADPASGRHPGGGRALPGRLAGGSGLLRRGAADLRAVRASARGSASERAARTSNRRSLRRSSARILASPTSTSTAGTGTSRTPPRSTGS